MNSPINDRTSDAELREIQGVSRFPNLRQLRIWPALLLILLIVVTRFGPGYLEGGLSKYWMVAVFGPLLCCFLIVIWWLTFSRATWKERCLGFVGLVDAFALTLALVDPTMKGPGISYLTVPMGLMAFAAGAVLWRGRQPLIRTGAALLLALAGFGFSTLLRNEGMTGDYELGTHWRWLKTPEESMLAARKSEARVPRARDESDPALLANAEWPGFRGADRASRSTAPQISTNWGVNPPKLLWKIPVGPAWSSFVVAGNQLFTQEQRGPFETVVCYDADTGREVWNREMETRFDDPLGGPGPRATPTLAAGGLFVTGATGKFLRLDPRTGGIVWQQELTTIADRKVPMWGFASSPLVVGSVVIVYAGGAGDKALLAFDTDSGKLRWSAAGGNDTYSSPQSNPIAGEDSVLLLTNDGLHLVDPATGKAQFNYEWKFSNYRALQPHLVEGDIVLLPTGMSTGTRAVRLARAAGRLAAEELWTSRNLKPDFSDLVTYRGYAYGNDNGILTCIDLKTGDRKWKGGRYGKGQILLLENSGLLLIASEQGRVVLVPADPNTHTELGSFKALEGKTWNHPVVIGDRLYVRNAQEAAAYRWALASTNAPMASAH